MPVYIIPAAQDPRRLNPVLSGCFKANVNSYTEFPPLSYPLNKIIANYTWGPPSHRKRAPFRYFGHFPTEIQEMVIERYMRQGRHLGRMIDVNVMREGSTNAVRPALLPAICWTSQAMRIMTIPVFLRNNIFTIRCIESNRFFDLFLSSIPDDKGYKALKEIHFTSFHWFPGVPNVPENSDLRLMARCTGLNRVKFTFHIERLTKPTAFDPDTGTSTQLKSIEELVKFYDLEKIFNCKDLRHILFDGIGSVGHAERCSGDPYKRLEELADWIKQEFLSRFNKNLEYEITWRSFSYAYGHGRWFDSDSDSD